MTSENDARSALEREIYWAEDASARTRMDTSEVRDLLHDFAMLMRADEKQAVPRGEPELGSGSRMRRKTKVLQFRLLRTIRRRNHRPRTRAWGGLPDAAQAQGAPVPAAAADAPPQRPAARRVRRAGGRARRPGRR